MSTRRRNTVVVDVSIMPVRPKPAIIKRFLECEIQLDMTQVKSIQLHNVRNNTLIEMYSTEAADLIAEQHHLKHFLEHNKKLYPIPVYVEDGAINVRVHDLDPELSNDKIIKHMRQFGEVIRIEDEVWTNFFPGIPNGVRVLRMKLSRAIPSYIVINNERTLVTYPNQIPTCIHCGRKVHFSMKCSEAAKKERLADRLVQNKDNDHQQHLEEEEYPFLPNQREQEVIEEVEILDYTEDVLNEMSELEVDPNKPDDAALEVDLTIVDTSGMLETLGRGSDTISPVPSEHVDQQDDNKISDDEDKGFQVVKQRRSRSKNVKTQLLGAKSKGNSRNTSEDHNRSRSNPRNK